MPLVTSKQMLLAAQAGGYAVGAFNANNMEMVQAVIQAAEEEQSPVILQVSQGAIAYAGLEFASSLVKVAAELASVPVVLHLDHGTDFFQNVRCLRAGFTSLMYDGSDAPLADNIATTRKIVGIAHSCDIPVEAELGKIPKIEDYEQQLPADYQVTAKLPPAVQERVANLMARVEDVERFVAETGCDSLAAALGSVHGMKSDVQPLNVARLQAIRQRTDIPLVLHGSSGVLRTRAEAAEKGIELAEGEGTLEDAIKNGICKINIATELSMCFLREVKAAFDRNPQEKDLRKVLKPGRDAVKESVRSYIRQFGAAGKGADLCARAGGIAGGEIKHHE